MGLVLVGISYRTAPVELRERLAIPASELPGLLKSLAGTARLEECLVLSTCNRVEVLARTPGEGLGPRKSNGAGGPAEAAAASGLGAIEAFLAARFDVDPSTLGTHCYRLGEREAVAHLFRVASGLDSMVLGEPQILGQVKTAYGVAREAGTLGPELESLLQRTFSVAKRVRTETAIARSPVSIASAAVEMACQIFGELSGHSVLLLGVGKMSQLAAQHLQAHGASPVLVATRTVAHAVEMAERIGGEPIPFEAVPDALGRVDIVLASTGAPHAVIRREHVERAMPLRRNRPLFFIDIAVPRDVEATVNALENVFLYDIDDLLEVVETNRASRQHEATAAEALVAQECDLFLRRRREAGAGPMIAAILQRAEEIRSAEVQRLRGRMGPLTERQEEQIESLTRSLISKMLHRPIREIKKAVEERGDFEAAEMARRLFDAAESRPPEDVTAEDAEESDASGRAKGKG